MADSRWRKVPGSTPRGRRRLLVSLIAGLSIAAGAAAGVGTMQPSRAGEATPEARAVKYLAREVPAWRREHACFSCHNNGDAPRALMAALRAGYSTREPLEDTLAWLGRPDRWEHNAGGEGGADDKPLARIQFAAALAAAVDQGLAGPQALVAAADLLAADQQPDGAWRLDSSQSLGSPATYGTTLATVSARRAIARAGQPRHAGVIGRADAWLRALDVKTVLDAAAVITGLEQARDEAARTQRQRCLELIRTGQAPSGGWGPYVTAAPEPFDTALVVLALIGLGDDPDLVGPVFSPTTAAGAVASGRAYLLARQEEEGSWPETTRPANQESYAQRISTTAWATLALLASGAR
jgi:hypothetical protein